MSRRRGRRCPAQWPCALTRISTEMVASTRVTRCCRRAPSAAGPAQARPVGGAVACGSGTGTGEPDGAGVVLLTGLPAGTRASVQVDPTTLPDIALAPVTRGIELVPRPGRVHRADFAVVAMSEIEGSAYFE